MTELPKAYTPRDVEGAIYERWLAADVFAPDGAGSTADPELPPFTIIQPPPNVTGSLHLGHAQRTDGRGPDDPPRPDARPRRAVPARPRPRRASPPSSSSTASSPRRARAASRSAASAISSGCVAFSESTRPVMLGQQRRVGASADWGRLRYTMDEGSAKSVRVAFERLYRDGLAYRTEALVNWCPGCQTSVSDLEVVPTPETGTLWLVRYHLVDDATGEPDPDPDRIGHRRDDPTRDDPGRHRRGRPSRRRALPRPRRAPRAHPVRRARRADHRRRRRRSAFGTGAVKITPGPRPGRPRDRQAPRPARPDDPRRRRHRREHGDGIRRPRPLRGATPDRGRPRRARRPRRRAGPRDDRRTLPAQRRRPGAPTQDAVVHPHGAVGRTRARRDPIGPDPHPAGALREDLGALAHEHPRLERQSPAVVGPSHPRLVLPRRPRDGVGRRGRPGRLRGVRAPGRASSSRTPTSSTRGSARACGRSRRSAGRTTRPTTRATTRPRSWRPPTTSSSSGSPG